MEKGTDFFDEHAEQWDTMSVHDDMKVRHIVDLLDIKGGESVLDVGTGTGILIPYYEERGVKNIRAIDVSKNMIGIARRKFPKSEHPSVDLEVQNIYDITEKECYDKVVCYSCFPHFQNKVRAVEVLSSTLKNGGMLAVVHSESRERIDERHRSHGGAVKDHVLPDISSLKKIFIDSGLLIIHERDDSEYYILIGVKPERAMTKDEMYAMLLKEFDDFKDEGRDVYFDELMKDYRRDLSDSPRSFLKVIFLFQIDHRYC